MPEVSRLRHYGGFILAGSSAFLTDVAVFQGLHALLSLNPLIARLISIAVAMVVSWLINRRLTFNVPGPPRLAEFLRFAPVVSLSNALNYVIFSGILIAVPETWPPLAIAVATGIAMVASYLGMRHAVFGKR